MKPDEGPNDIIERNKEQNKEYNSACLWNKDPSKAVLPMPVEESIDNPYDAEERQAALDLIIK
jgi:hypothetical protein